MPNLIQPSLDFYPLTGGLDLTTPPIMMKPGSLMASSNVEMVAGIQGYGRVDGFEPIDGTELPSEALLTVITIDDSGVGTSVIGDEYTSPTDPDVLLFAINEVDLTTEDNIVVVYSEYNREPTVGAIYTGGANSFVIKESTNSVRSVAEDATTYYAAAVEMVRDATEEVPGTGNTHGTFYFDGDVYAFIDDGSGNGLIYKTSLAGWVAVDMPHVLYFSAGLDGIDPFSGIQVGDDAEGVTSTVTGVVSSITRWAGEWDGATVPEQATGYITFDTLSGTFLDGETIEFSRDSGPVDVTAVAEGDSAQYELNSSEDGNIETIEYNFYADIEKNAVYGVDEKNYAFEFNGTSFIPIIPEGYQDIFPTHIADHAEQLYLVYPGGNIIYSALVSDDGSVRVFNPVFNAGSWNTGQEIVAAVPSTGGTVTFACNSSLWILSGSGDTARLLRFKEKVGAEENSVSGMGDAVFIYGHKLFSLSATQAFGDFIPKAILPKIYPFIEERNKKITCSLICKAKSQYRLFFSDRTWLSVAFDGNQAVGATTGILPIVVRSAWADMSSDGSEDMYFTSDDAFVYKMDSGDTFNDEPITGFFRLPFYHYGSPRNWKQFVKLILEMRSPVLLTKSTSISYTLNFNYGNIAIPGGVTVVDDDIQGGGGFYDTDYTYGNFIYSGQAISEISEDIEGVGTNMSILINFESRYDKAFMFHACLVDQITMGVSN